MSPSRGQLELCGYAGQEIVIYNWQFLGYLSLKLIVLMFSQLVFSSFLRIFPHIALTAIFKIPIIQMQ